jgi:hypothetical protein
VIQNPLGGGVSSFNLKTEIETGARPPRAQFSARPLSANNALIILIAFTPSLIRILISVYQYKL